MAVGTASSCVIVAHLLLWTSRPMQKPDSEGVTLVASRKLQMTHRILQSGRGIAEYGPFTFRCQWVDDFHFGFERASKTDK